MMDTTANPDSASGEGVATAKTPCSNILAGERKHPLSMPIKVKEEHKTAFRNFVRIFSYSTKWEKCILLVSTTAAVGAGVTMPIMNMVFGKLVSTFTGYYNPWSGETEGAFTQAVNECVLYIVYLFAAKLCCSYIAHLGYRIMSLRISASIRLVYIKSLFSLPISTLDTLPPGQTAAIITITASVLQLGISEKLAGFFQNLSLVVAALVIALKYNWALCLVTSTGLVFIAIIYGTTTPLIVKKMGEVQNEDLKASSVSTEALASVRMLAACGAEEKMIKRYTGFVEQARKKGSKMAWFVAAQQAPVFFAVYATFALAFYYCFKMYMSLQITSPEAVIIVLLCVMMIATSIRQITAPLAAAAHAATAAGIFYTIIDAPKPAYGTAKPPDVSADGDIVLHNVNFTYPKRPDTKVLDNLTLLLKAGRITAIVGPSGSGKSTIVGVLERWYEFNGDPNTNALILWLRNGLVKVGEHKLSDIDICWWRNQIGLVQQDSFLFNTTIFENVSYGLVGTEWEHADIPTKERLIREACRSAYADEFISRLPDGYQTQCGDAGIKLSGGQRQRLTIARAIVKQPKILILDEATSAIDVRGEQIVQAALNRACEGRTTLMIAHRLSTVRKAHNIVVLDKGRVVQWGTHEQMMKLPEEPYYKLATAQKLDMGEEDESEPEKGITDETSFIQTIVTTAPGDGSPTLVSSSEGSMPEAGAKQRGFFTSFGTMFWEQKTRWKWYVVILLAALGSGASAPLQAYLFASLVSLFGIWGPELPALASFWCLMFVVLAAGVGVSHFALGLSTTRLGFTITRVYRTEYFRNLLSKPVSFFDGEGHSTGALTARLATDPTQLQELLGTNMSFVLISIFSAVGCIAIALYFGWKLALVALSSSMPVILASMFYRLRHEMDFERMNNEVFAESAKFATESIAAMRTVSSLTMENTICSRYEQLLNDHIREAFRKSRFSVVIFALSDSIQLLCMAFVLWYGAGLLAKHEYWPFQYVVVYIAVVQGAMSAGQWLSFGPNIAAATGAANRIMNMRIGEDVGDQLTVLDPVTANEKDMGVEIDFRDVWFRYPTRDAPVLNGLSFRIEKGQFAAIVGPSGSGKTTIISLLERFYNITSGSIGVNGLEISKIELSSYRKNISLVAQEPYLFEGSIRDNVLLGVDESAVLDQDIEAVCRDAGIHDFIISLPEGYDTSVGNKGVALSGGQKQRVSIARALIRTPRLLLLDEATSSLDSETERAVQDTFERTKGSRTMVVVAHKLATVANADVIFVMGDGKVIERGNHANLVAKKGVYYQMCQSQALDR